MRRDSRLSSVLHVLLHMARHVGPVTSGQLAGAMQTNPVVVRRVLAGLREQGYVASAKGHGGGWRLGEPPLLAIGNRTESPGCLVEQAVNAVLGKTFADAEALLLARLGDITLAALAADVRKRYRAHPRARKDFHEHEL